MLLLSELVRDYPNDNQISILTNLRRMWMIVVWVTKVRNKQA